MAEEKAAGRSPIKLVGGVLLLVLAAFVLLGNLVRILTGSIPELVGPDLTGFLVGIIVFGALPLYLGLKLLVPRR